jgi:WhiB family redox-sensing transcriptional regulator
VNEKTPAIRYAEQRIWLTGAACRHHDPELFFPVSVGRAAVSQVAKAKRICDCCPVARQCLEYALQTGQPFGVWGGTTENERRVIRRSRRRRDGAAVSAGRAGARFTLTPAASR